LESLADKEILFTTPAFSHPSRGELAAESLKWGVLWVETGVFKA